MKITRLLLITLTFIATCTAPVAEAGLWQYFESLKKYVISFLWQTQHDQKAIKRLTTIIRHLNGEQPPKYEHVLFYPKSRSGSLARKITRNTHLEIQEKAKPCEAAVVEHVLNLVKKINGPIAEHIETSLVMGKSPIRYHWEDVVCSCTVAHNNHTSSAYILVTQELLNLPLEEQLFSIAHEIGHIVAGHCSWNKDGKHASYNLSTPESHRHEFEADAAAVKMTLDIDSGIRLLKRLQSLYGNNPSPKTQPSVTARIDALEALRPEIEKLKAKKVKAENKPPITLQQTTAESSRDNLIQEPGDFVTERLYGQFIDEDGWGQIRYYWKLYNKRNNDFVGFITIYKHGVEITADFENNYIGQGLGQEAAAVIVDIAFNQMGAEKITAKTISRYGSHLAQKGMQEHQTGCGFFSLTKDQWENLKQTNPKLKQLLNSATVYPLTASTL
jgi:Zn-dependent protease with chaperone function